METQTSLWLYQSLHSEKLDEKSSFNIPDTILFNNGVLDKWVFSNRQGQVVRKRPGSETQLNVKEKFAKIASASLTNYQGRACVLRHRDGSFSLLDGVAFQEFAEVWPPSDPGILAVQSYVQGRGNQGTIFRSTYRVVNSSGRVSLKHASYLSLNPGSEEEATVKIGNENLSMIASKGASTNETFSSLMKNAVSQVERVRKCKVISMTADFLIDYQDQIWLLWMDDVQFLSGENAKDLSAVGIRSEPDMRGSWLNGNPHGPFPSAKEQKENAKNHKSPKTSPIRVSNELMGAMAARVETDGETRRNDMKLAMDRTIFIDPKNPQKMLRPTSPFKTPGVGAGRPVGLQLLGGEGPKEEAMGAEITLAKPDRSQYPSNIKCNGQFCNLRIRDASELRNARGDGGKVLEGHEALSNQYASVRKLKKGDMNDILGKAKKMSIKEYYSVPYASIYRAKTESQLAEASYRRNNTEIETAWQAYPTTPREHKRQFNLDEDYWKLAHGETEDPNSLSEPGAVDYSNTSNDVRKHTVASKIKSEWGEKIGEVQVPGGTQNFYRRVNVCGECCRAYMLLDKAREILHMDKDEEEGKKKFAALTDGIPDDPHAVHAAWTRREEGKADANSRMRKAAGGGQLANDVFHQDSTHQFEGGPSVQFDDSAMLNASTISPGGDPQGVEYLFFPSPKKGMTFEEHQEQNTQQQANSRPMTSPLPKKPKRKRGPNQQDEFRPMTSPEGRNRPPRNRLNQDSIGNDSEAAFNEHYKRPLPRRRTTTVPPQPGSPPKPTWKARRAARQQIEQEYEARGEQAPLPEAFGGKFDKLDKFLRGEGGEDLGNKNSRRANELMSDTASASYVENFKQSTDFDMYRAKVLVAINDMGEAEPIAQCLEEQGYIVAFENDGITVMDILHSGNYDCLVVQNDLFVKNAKEITSVVRDRERSERKKATRKMALDARNRNQTNILDTHNGDSYKPARASHPSQVKSLPILVYTEKVAPDDLKSYMEAGMDGCLSRPFDQDALLTTLRQAVPKHMKPREDAQRQDKAVRYKNKNFTLNSKPTNDSSSDLIAKTLALSASFANNEGSVSGVLQFDADTVFPYTVMDSSIDAAGQAGRTGGKQKQPFFNLVVCHDLFDTSERMKIFLRPISRRYPGLQILLWNYPGQAFTTFREEQLLNNEFHAQCLNSLFDHVGPDGTGQFDTNKPFYILGYGNGGNIASFYSAFYADQMKSLRSLILINSFSYVDPHMASVLHDCMNVFSCSPPNRPDLPIYFFSRFLFSPTYLSSVSTPLALNLYTAVHNPITLPGRIQLCLGALSHIDLRNNLKEIPVPIINVQGSQDALVRPMHTDMFISKRDGETKSIHRCLQAHANNPKARRTCQIWVNSGHEVFQEKRNQILQLVEQMVIGYHENSDVSFMPAMSVDREAAIEMDGDLKNSMKLDVGGRKPLGEKSLNGSIEPEKFEDHFVGNLTAKLGGLNKKRDAMMKKYEEDEDEGMSYEERVDKENARWSNFSVNVSKANHAGGNEQGGKVGKRVSKYSSKSGLNSNSIVGGQSVVQIVTDPTKASFEKNNRVIHGHKKQDDFGLYANPEAFPEVQEYMGWRLKRNKKRLMRLDAASRIIQGAYRAHLAWQIIKKLREERAVQYIQRCYRGWKGRLEFLEKMRLVWAAQLVQRNWRGHAGREQFLRRRVESGAMTHIQRVWRGYVSRRLVRSLHEARWKGACSMQSCWRKRKARQHAFAMRIKRNSSMLIQRVYRGHLGRRRCAVERDKFLFSRSQSQGIAFGRQMLLEHKLHATKLQSEVSVLTQEKVKCEEHIESLLDEISEFEEGVKTLEKEMHQLSKIQTESEGVLDEEAKVELRDQKIRLDSEFSQMLANIADRKENLTRLESNMVLLDRSRQAKEEELRVLERKLVVLLEEQQNELESIRRRQERKGEALIEGKTSVLTTATGGAGAAGGGGFQGPSAKDKRQAAQLMQSTETLMKFGFMSMSMTYFSSLNMVRAMRTVAATDTVMAAVHENVSNKSMITGGGGGGGGDGGGGGLKQGGLDTGLDGQGSGQFEPDLKPGRMPGQGEIRVSAWSVVDVSKWLQSISLAQYRTAFLDAAVDGAFLYDLNDDDLKNTLGVEHRLHRKKMLNTIARLKEAETAKDREMVMSEMAERHPPPGFNGPALGYANGPIGPQSGVMAMVAPGANPAFIPQLNEEGGIVQQQPVAGGDDAFAGAIDLNITEMASWVRHSKLKKLTKALEQLPTKRFDVGLIKVQYVEEYGTQYIDSYERDGFHLNQTLEHGNTLLHISAQNGNIKIAKLLIRYGANVNHQNRYGQCAGHFAIAYTFYDYSAWLFDPDGGGADDTLENIHGLGPYDGLAGEEDQIEQDGDGVKAITSG
ncbi:hypothetical protein TrLO_g11513 [Triparma laevis f. longispina]|uniref:Response regulatory domain-containing protein n=1 Tax=Triparma laevis f. longispina TaxID=1714387 RepID=A0A9W7C9E9_9STRA|nr:hypothetical protein TrLO_g11513 [Triparma laevis f. longispina]